MGVTIVKCIVSDKKVVEVLRALKPFALEPPVADPMDEIQSKPNGIARKSNTPGTVRMKIMDHVEALINKGIKTVSAEELRKFCIASGFSERSYSYPLGMLLKNKVLKKTKQTGIYEVA